MGFIINLVTFKGKDLIYGSKMVKYVFMEDLKNILIIKNK